MVSLTRQSPLTSHAGFTAAQERGTTAFLGNTITIDASAATFVAIPAKLKQRRMGYFNPYLNMTFYTPTKVIALRRHKK